MLVKLTWLQANSVEVQHEENFPLFLSLIQFQLYCMQPTSDLFQFITRKWINQIAKNQIRYHKTILISISKDREQGKIGGENSNLLSLLVPISLSRTLNFCMCGFAILIR
ncbi:hypothetical protein AAHE18_19G124100 [Arachis hypogaea]